MAMPLSSALFRALPKHHKAFLYAMPADCFAFLSSDAYGLLRNPAAMS
jgi:hypothetical protein